MLTIREARQRLELSGMTLSRVGASVNYRVTFSEDGHKDNERNAYYTDCIEDALFQGQKMRRSRGRIAA
jgi:hypothetical protein